MKGLTEAAPVLKTLLVSDLVESTRLVETLGDGPSARLLRRHERIARNLLNQHHGREIDKTDGFLLLFERPIYAVLYALALHLDLAKLSREENLALECRVGIHVGEVILHENPPNDVARGAKPLEVEGLAKPVAARLMSLAQGRQTLLSQGAFDLARRGSVGTRYEVSGLRWLAHGRYRFQGVEDELEVFEVGVEGVAPMTPPNDSPKAWRVKAAVAIPGSSRLPVSRPAPSIAVLPFVNLSADPENEYFSDGLAEDVILALSQMRELSVPARSTSFSFRHKGLDGCAIGRELGVEAVLEGSVRRAGDRLRISVQLINVPDGNHLWAGRFDRTMKDIFAIQDEISQAVVKHLIVKLLGAPETSRIEPPTADIRAYDLYLKGRHFWIQRTEEGFRRAAECFEQAIAQDSTFALAYAGLADNLTIQGFLGYRSPIEAFPRALSNALMAVELDDSRAESHFALASIRLAGNWDIGRAERGFLRAIELNPRWAIAQAYCAVTLAIQGRHEDALQLIRQALEIEPVSVPIFNCLFFVHMLARRFESLTAACHDALDFFPENALAHFCLALFLGHRSQLTEAQKWFSRLERFVHQPHVKFLRGYLHALEGARQEARTVASELAIMFEKEYVSPIWIAAIFAASGDSEGAMNWVRKVVSIPDPQSFLLVGLPCFDELCEDPEFLSVLREIGLRP